MPAHVDPALLETWVKGWTMARETAAPVAMYGGSFVSVGWSTQKARYVFPRWTDEVASVAQTIDEPFVFLKVCASPEAVRPLLPAKLVIDRLGYLMTCESPMSGHHPVADPYTLEVRVLPPVAIARVLTQLGEEVAVGRVVLLGEHAIYDRIEVHPEHRRRGLARGIMHALESHAREQRATRGILVATDDGRALYTALGWEVQSLYTTAVIPTQD